MKAYTLPVKLSGGFMVESIEIEVRHIIKTLYDLKIGETAPVYKFPYETHLRELYLPAKEIPIDNTYFLEDLKFERVVVCMVKPQVDVSYKKATPLEVERFLTTHIILSKPALAFEVWKRIH